MPISQVTRYSASDGSVFNSIEEAEAHEVRIQADGEMDAFGERHEIAGRTMATLKKYLPLMIAELGYIKAPQQAVFDDTQFDDTTPDLPPHIAQAAAEVDEQEAA
jgi:hypothetical protein